MNTRRLLTLALCAFGAALALRVLPRQVLKFKRITEHTVAPASTVSAAARSLRPIYPYSVIPGGAYSPDELRTANEKDKVVREHYADFEMQSAHLVTLTEDRYQYVSYRVKNKVYWTRHKLRIPKGELLLTDGRNYCRARCGNRLSSRAKASVARLGPSDRLLMLPNFTPEMLSSGDITLAPPPDIELPRNLPELPFDLADLLPTVPVERMLSQPAAQSWPPIGGYPAATPILTGFPLGQVTVPVTPIPPVTPVIPGGPVITADVPEPASLYLFGLSFCVSFWFLIRMMRGEGPSAETCKNADS